MKGCYYCGEDLSDLDVIGRSTTCPACKKEVKVCLNCRFYDPSSHWECKENIPERVAEKDRSNFCDYFELKSGSGGSGKGLSSSDQAKKAFNDLFG